MGYLKNKSGFTLIEIIVVMIIVGILAAIALPNLFGNVQKSRAAQAIAVLDTFESITEGCLAQNSTLNPGFAPCTLTAQNLLTTASIWTFSIGTAGDATSQTATLGQSVTPAGSADANNTLTYSFVASDGTYTITLTRSTIGLFTCSTGTGNPYSGIC